MKHVDKVVLTAFEEDMPFGDITTDNIIAENSISKARLIAKEDGVLAGVPVAVRTFELLSRDIKVEVLLQDGAKVKKGDIIANIEGPTREILKGERTALNLLQRLSGVATATNKLVELVKDYPVNVVDTRKTTPGLRYLEKYAVRVGGGQNHRFSLSDGVLIKDNHISAAGGIKNAVEMVRRRIPHTVKIEVETENLEMVREALDVGADIIMLDNMTNEMMSEAVKLINKKALVEASGDINEQRIVEVTKTGVDIISVGRITHSVKALDISLRFYN
ncbi:MAG: carboxylating nicotinate-nucleotide diphosphorylase [Clostridiaceae bacterium]|nr:carboxylating nicotinate-nucleotide diphosphorylase [Clostridiaceae bacterium]